MLSATKTLTAPGRHPIPNHREPYRQLFRIDASTETLFRGAEPLPIGRRAVALLRALIERPGMPVAKDALIEAAWPGLAVEESNLTVQIATLRRALGEEPGGDRWIETLPRRGYRFVGPLAISENANAPLGPLPLTPPDKPSVAVVPFANRTDDPEQEYFSDGIAEDIITILSRSRSLFVIARNSSFAFRGGAVDVKHIAGELGVRYVLEGSVRRDGNRVRVTAQLVDAGTGNHLWAERYDRELTDIFAVQDEIAEAVAIAIEPTVAEMERLRAIRRPPESLGAWESARSMAHGSSERGGEREGETLLSTGNRNRSDLCSCTRAACLRSIGGSDVVPNARAQARFARRGNPGTTRYFPRSDRCFGA